MANLTSAITTRIARMCLDMGFRLSARAPRGRDATVREIARRHSLDVLPRHYYSPIPDPEDCARAGFWDETSSLVGLDLGDDEALCLLRDVFPPHLAEFRSRFPLEGPAPDGGFFLVNGVYMAVDAHVYWCLIRHAKPRRIVEIGSGQSTLLAAEAAAWNRERDGAPCALTAIEPYPSAQLRALADAGRVTLRAQKVQEAGLDAFAELAAGDFLFIDSSHVLREGNDVQFEYLELLPRLTGGVFVHVHDISLPRRYPRVYFDQGLYWNEQYLLQALLAFSTRFRVVWAGNHLLLAHQRTLTEAFPEIAAMRAHFSLAEPSAFWMQVRPA